MEQTQNFTGTIAAYFDDNANARQAVEALQQAGFSSAHIGVARRAGSITETDAQGTMTSRSQAEDDNASLTTWDKVKRWFSGSEAEPYADERTQGELATREITEAPGDTRAYDENYNPDDLHGSFNALNVPAEHSRYFAHRLGKGQNSAVVTVNAGERRTAAQDILTRSGGDLAANAASYDYADTGNDRETARDTSGESVERGNAGRSRNDIQLLGEVLRVHKDRVNRGEVRIRKEVITETQTVQVPVTREELVIERRPGNDATAPQGTIGETEIRVPLSEEQASINKATVVREEVSVGKKAVEEVRDLSGEVRHEELVVEDPDKRVA